MKRMSAVAIYVLVGAMASVGYLALPNPRAWTTDDGRYLLEAFRRGQEVAAATFPDWRPAESPVLVTKGAANFLVNFPEGAVAPAGRPIQADGLRVLRLDRPEIPVVANGVAPVNGLDVVVLAGKAQLESAFGGLMAEQSLAGTGESGLVKGLMRTEAGRRFTDEEYLGVILHEAFHLYQVPVLNRWPVPTTPESILWVTAYTDAENNRLQNQEAAHLLAAVQAASVEEARREAAAFLRLRADRKAYWSTKAGTATAEAILEWERLYEWLEGLARYIQVKAQQSGQQELVAAIGHPVDPVMARERVYTMGAGQALLLDRLQPGWQQAAGQGRSLHSLLEGSLH